MSHLERQSVNRIRKNKREQKNESFNLNTVKKYLKSCRTYLGSICVNSFKNLLLKVEEYSLIVHCNYHWFCIYSTKTTFEIFDPKGVFTKLNYFKANFLNFIKCQMNGKSFYSNPRIQSDASKKRGLYLIFFIRMRELGHSFCEIVRKFSKNFIKNDSLVNLFVNKMYSV